MSAAGAPGPDHAGPPRPVVAARLPLQHPPRGPRASRVTPGRDALRPVHMPLGLRGAHCAGRREAQKDTAMPRAPQLGARLPHLPVEWGRQGSSLPLGLGEGTMRVFFSEIIRIPNGKSGGELELTELASLTNTDPEAETPPPPPQPTLLVEMRLHYPSWPLGGAFRPCTWLHTPL